MGETDSWADPYGTFLEEWLFAVEVQMGRIVPVMIDTDIHETFRHVGGFAFAKGR